MLTWTLVRPRCDNTAVVTVRPQGSDITARQVETDLSCALTLMQGQTDLTVSQDLRRRWEGQLNKFTNVVKGWQYRWFILEPTTGWIVVSGLDLVVTMLL